MPPRGEGEGGGARDRAGAALPSIIDAPLAPTPSVFARVRSRASRAIVAGLLPRSVLFVRGARARKRIALTFDDGPDAMTPAYLDVLRALDVQATFFVIGAQADEAPETMAAYVRDGHEVGGHGWTHDPFASMDRATLARELGRTAAVLPLSERGLPLVRPPRGSLSARSLLQIATAGYVSVLWSVDSDDCRTRAAADVERRLAPPRVSGGDVVLLHELQPWTLDALPGVVRRLREDGYELVTVSDLMNEASDERE
jgi:peptidoglycan/xylan/chitin deacetylase (PgdA/CDA1 family)